ncbi:hypothetical protein [Rodentibacter pneumotropicus]|uniref:Uncharacterized protein n=1 Tax=Rodentibacter pneumotropicus TaxID=758 RepID=A0A4S2Q316_9PAST|nr:hypothetical protein [Rodentibacter pneumotropicus]THA10474.1 hypothetical protein D3M78_02945 [Rodentibacter pneumotropicus]
MQKKIIQWLADDEDVGLSSKCMAFVVGFDVVPRRKHYPLDPSDLSRCVKLLVRVPEMRNYLYKMKAISPIWTKLVEHWDELERLLNEEKGTGRYPKTYQLMQELTKDDRNVIFRQGGVSIRRE